MLNGLFGLRGRAAPTLSPSVRRACGGPEHADEGRVEADLQKMPHAEGPDSGFAYDRRSSVERTLQASLQNEDFRRHVGAGDAYRDQGRWGDGEHEYWLALRLYPLHRSYRVQYGHCLKEQGKFLDAEVQYRNAIALGDLESDVVRHLRFVAEKSGRHVSAHWLQAAGNFWRAAGGVPFPLAAPATQQDIYVLSELLLGHTEITNIEIVRLLDRAPRQCDIAKELIAMPGFVHANRDLVRVIAETKDAL